MPPFASFWAFIEHVFSLHESPSPPHLHVRLPAVSDLQRSVELHRVRPLQKYDRERGRFSRLQRVQDPTLPRMLRYRGLAERGGREEIIRVSPEGYFSLAYLMPFFCGFGRGLCRKEMGI
jgi:hypothetical protein